jgi:4-amino-4-deoxy-L-arabinose transferase-like glycosyltransferase
VNLGGNIFSNKAVMSSVPKPVLGAIFFALGVNLLFLGYYFLVNGSFNTLVTGDGLGYLELANNLIDGEGFGRSVPEGYVFETFRTPGLPVLLGFFVVSGLGLTGYFLTISILSSIIIPLCTWYIGRKLFSNLVGVVSAWLVVLEPLVYLHNWLLLTEIPFLICSLVAVCLYINDSKKFRLLTFAAIGLFLAISVLVRPGALLLIIVVITALVIYNLKYNFAEVPKVFFICGVFVAILLPWVIYMHSNTGVYAVSGTGWRNVYTDYLASLRSINNQTTFPEEKNLLKAYAVDTWNFSSTDINSPANSHILKAYALPEIYDNIPLVIKLQSLLFISYFTHTDYLSRLVRLDIIDRTPAANRESITQLVLSKGLRAIPEVYAALKSQYFIPVVERLWSLSIFAFAAIGFFSSYKNKIVWLIILTLAIGYLTSSAIGLGIEGRLRLPVLPFYLFLTSLGILAFYNIVYRELFEKYEKKN